MPIELEALRRPLPLAMSSAAQSLAELLQVNPLPYKKPKIIMFNLENFI